MNNECSRTVHVAFFPDETAAAMLPAPCCVTPPLHLDPLSTVHTPPASGDATLGGILRKAIKVLKGPYSLTVAERCG